MLLLLSFVPLPAAGSPSAPVPGVSWGSLLLGIVIGASALGLFHWFRLRRLRHRTERETNALQNEKEEIEAALAVAEKRAEKLEEVKGAESRFLKEVSHAFRRPLTLTLGPIDTLLDEQHGPLHEDVQTQLRLAQRNGTRVLWLVNQLLDLAELETDSMSLSPTEGDLPPFVRQCVRSFEDLAERRNVDLTFDSSLDDPEVHFDNSKMETMLANLLSSVFRTADEKDAVQVSVRPDGADADHIELLVEHTGTEISSALDDSFDWSRESLHEPDNISAYVGLYLVEELADLHGGHLQTPSGAGEHTRIAVRLPRRPPQYEEGDSYRTEIRGGDTIPRFLANQEEERSPLELSRRALVSVSDTEASWTGPTLSPNPTHNGLLPGEEALPAAPNGSNASARSPNGEEPFAEDGPDQDDRTTVLVIDDNSVICTLVRAHLEPEYRVVEAHDGAEGYALARSILPDLVITDVMMPEVDGFELCRKIKEDPDVDHVPVVFLTARADLNDRVEGYDTGADAYFTKPFEPEALIARVENLIETRHRLRASFQAGTAATEDAGTSPEGISLEGIENAESALPPTAGADSLEEQVEAAIAESLTDPEFGVSELAEATALSASQLRRRMKEVYERTPVQLIRRRRLEAGAQLLRERTDATIGEVAYAVGFNSQSYFSRSFREEFGTSPSRFRAEGVGA